ncbi:MAG: histidine phosphatase family protein [Coriobacteriia bacterium]|nr:histidine phosphatase family protein [Coriobacteriia bacterium]
MNLYMLRHGPALSREEWSGPDDLRPLSADGMRAVADVAARIEALGIGTEVVLTSPYERALRTATMICDVLGDGLLPVPDRRLEPLAFNAPALAEMLEPYIDATAVMLVGHEPSMSVVLSQIVGGGQFVLRKAGLARVKLDPGSLRRGVLEWLAPPRLWR